MSGWIKLHRQFKDNGHFHMPDRALKIWLYILMTVSHRDQPQWDLRAGEGWISYNMIAEDCSEDPRQRVRREAISQTLKYLEDHGYIERSISPGRGQKIRVVNWPTYQHTHTEEGGSTTSSAGRAETEPEQTTERPALYCRGSEAEHVAEPQAELIQEVLTPTTTPPISPPLDALAGQDDRSLSGGDGADATQAERAMLGEMRRVKGYPFDYATDLNHLRDLAVDFPDVDIAEEIKRWVTHKLDKPLKPSSNPRLQLRNWMAKARQFQQERGGKRSHGFSSGDEAGDRTSSRRASPHRGREAKTNLGSDLDVGFFGAALSQRDSGGRVS